MIGIRKALAFSILTQHSVQVISLISVVVLSRLLTPAEVGVYAIASSVAILAIELRSLGVGQYLVREKEINEQKIRSAIGVMMIISWGLGAILAIAAPFIRDFYNEPALMFLLWIISFGFVVAPFTTVPHALLSRDMRFQKIFLATFLSNFSLTASTILMVLLGMSYYGLAFGIMIGSLVEFVAINYYAPKGTPWRPSLKGAGKLFKLGVLISATQMFTRFSESISDLVIGRAGTVSDVGLFSRGFGLIVFLNRIIVLAAGPVILPYLSEIKRAGNNVGDAYLRVINLQSAFSLPVFAVVNVAVFPIFRIMFGDQWDVAIPIASILALWGMLQAIHSFSGTALISVGAEILMFRAALVTFLARLGLVIAAAVYVAPFNLQAIAWALVLSGLIELFIKTIAIKIGIGLSIRKFIRTFIPNMIVTANCWGTLTTITYFFPLEQMNPWLAVLMTAVTMTSVWLLSLWLTRHILFASLLDILKSILARRAVQN